MLGRGLVLAGVLAGAATACAHGQADSPVALRQSPDEIEHAAEQYAAFLARPAPGATPALVASVRVRLGTAYFLLHRYRDSLQALGPIVSRADGKNRAHASARPLLAQAWLICGLDRLQMDQPAQAVLPLQRALGLNPKDANARLALGDALARTRDMQGAEKKYEEQLRQTPSLPDAWYKLGMVHVQLAADWKRDLTQKDAGDAWSQQLSAEAALESDANWDAARVLLRLVKAAPRQPGVHADLGRALLALGYAKAAAGAFRSELGIDPESPWAMMGLAETSLLAGRWSEAKTQLDHIATSQPRQAARITESAPPGPIRQAWNDGLLKMPESVAGTPEGRFWKSWLAASLVGPDVFSAIAAPEEACAAQAAAPAINAGEWLSEACYRSLAARLAKRTALSAAERAKLAEAYFRLGRSQDAIREAQMLLRRDPRDASAMYWLSRAHAELAGDCFVKLALLNPSSPRVHQMLAERDLGFGQFAQAESEYKAAIALAPELPDLYLGLGDTYARMLDWADAVTEYRKTLELAPGSLTAQAELGHAYAKLGDWPQAIAQLKQIPDGSPDAAAARLDLANAEDKIGDTRQAIADLLPYADKDHDGEIHFRLAFFYRRIGDAADADWATKAFQALRAAQLAVSHNEIQALEDEKPETQQPE